MERVLETPERFVAQEGISIGGGAKRQRMGSLTQLMSGKLAVGRGEEGGWEG